MDYEPLEQVNTGLDATYKLMEHVKRGEGVPITLGLLVIVPDHLFVL